MKLLMAIILLIASALVAGAYVDVNPVIPILLILGFGFYRVCRMDAPPLPEGSRTYFGGTHGVYLRRRDFAPPDSESHSGGQLRDGVDPNEPAGTLRAGAV